MLEPLDRMTYINLRFVVASSSIKPYNLTTISLQEIAAIVTTLGVIFSLLFLTGMRNYREVSRSKNFNDPREKTITIPKTLNIFLSPVIYQVSSL